MRLLLTGFEPFHQWSVNPSQEVVRALADEPFAGVEVRSAILPVSFAETGARLRALIDEHDPQVVLMLGQGGGGALRVERVGINLNDVPGRTDNRGATAEEEPIASDGPDAYFATIPVRALTRHVCSAGVPAVESRTAGAFLCNHVLYSARHHVATTGRDRWVGFIHLPLLPEQAAANPAADKPASMALATQVAGVRAAIAFLATAHTVPPREPAVAR